VPGGIFQELYEPVFDLFYRVSGPLPMKPVFTPMSTAGTEKAETLTEPYLPGFTNTGETNLQCVDIIGFEKIPSLEITDDNRRTTNPDS
jgi:hypothetical protein